MAKWYEKYLSIYGKSYKEVPDEVLDQIKRQLAAKQNPDPLISIVVIAYNEEMRLAACLWSLSELQTNYPIEILGVNNNSKDRTERVYQRLGLPYFNESKQSPGYARQCGLDHAKGKYHFCIDADTFYPPRYVDLMMTKLSRPDVSCVSSFWSFFPDEKHSALGLHLFELAHALVAQGFVGVAEVAAFQRALRQAVTDEVNGISFHCILQKNRVLLYAEYNLKGCCR